MQSYNHITVDPKTGASTAKAVALLEKAGVSKAVGAAITTSSKTATVIHAAAMQALMHAAEHGDPVYLDRMFKGIHDSQRPLSIKRWAMAHGPLGLTQNKAGEEVLRVLPKTRKDGSANPAYRPWDIQKAAENPYWTFKGDAKVEDFTLAQLLKLVANAIKKGEKAIDEDQFGGNVVNFTAAKKDLEGVIEKYANAGQPQVSQQQSAPLIATPQPVATPEPVQEPDGLEVGQVG